MLGTLRAQKAAPQSDVAILDVTVSKAGTDDGIFVKLDDKLVPNIARLRPEARFSDVGGVGVTFDNFMIIYNSELVKTPPTSRATRSLRLNRLCACCSRSCAPWAICMPRGSFIEI